MNENKQIFNDEIEFDDEIDYGELEDSNENDEDIIDEEEISSFAEVECNLDTDEQPQEETVVSESANTEYPYEKDIDEDVVTLSEEPEPTVDAEPVYIDEAEEKVSEISYSDEEEAVCEEPAQASDNISVNRFFIINTAISAVTLCAVAAGITLGYNYINSLEKDLSIKSAEIAELEKKNSVLEEDYLEAMSHSESGQAELTETDKIEADDGKIVLYDSSVGYSWMPVLAGIEKNNYKAENFSVDNRGRMSYAEAGDESSYFGIDVSSYQGDIDWQLVKEDNVEFAFLRIGYRGYGEEGKLCPDEKFAYNYEAAHNSGMDLGVYFFSQAISVDEAIEEAEYVLSLLEGRTLEYPIVFDWETVQTGDPEDIPRTEDVMPRTLTLSAIAFCETIRDAGYDAMIYTNKKLATIKYDLRMLQDYPIWLAYYDTSLNYCYDFDIWQYGTGQVDGIEGEVDVNIAIIK